MPDIVPVNPFPRIVASTSTANNNAALTNILNFSPPPVNGIYRINVVLNMSTWTTPASFTIVVSYRAEDVGIKTVTLGLMESDGTFATAVDTADLYFGIPLTINLGSTSSPITVSTTGTFTGAPNYAFTATLEQLA